MNEDDRRRSRREPESFYNASLKTVLAENSAGRRTEQEFITRKDDLNYPNSIYRFAILCASGGIYLGYFSSIFNPLSKPMLTGVYGITGKDYIQAKGNINMYFSLGAALGCLFSGYITDKIGRWRAIIFSLLLESLCYGLYSIEIYEVLLISR